MKMVNKIHKAINNDYKGVDGLIAVAYWIGKHDAAKEVCDKHSQIISGMRKRADVCRYHKMAHSIIGEHDIIYHPDYDSDFPSWDMEEIIE